MRRKFFVLLTVMLMASFCFSITAYAASSYTANLAFQGRHVGPTREYTGQDMNWSGYTYTRGQEDSMPNTFHIYLYRKNLIGATCIGNVVCDRKGNHDIDWTNVGSGKYYFLYEKAYEGADVISDSVTMSMS